MPPVDMKTRRESSRPSASKVVTKLTHSDVKIGILPSKRKGLYSNHSFSGAFAVSFREGKGLLLVINKFE